MSTIVITGVFSLELGKDWDELNKRMAQPNARAINILYYTLNVNEFYRISICISIKEIYDRLEVIHEDINYVKESQINIFVHRYKLFKIEPHETITTLYTKFTDIIHRLKSLDKSYTNNEPV